MGPWDIRIHSVFAAAFAARIELRELSGEPVTEAHEDEAYAHAESVAGRAMAAHERVLRRAEGDGGEHAGQ